MRVMLQAWGLWIAVSLGTDDYVEDQMALEVIAKPVPPEMTGTIAAKSSAKAAWDAIRLMNVGVERVCNAKANTLRREFDALKFQDGETRLWHLHQRAREPTHSPWHRRPQRRDHAQVPSSLATKVPPDRDVN
ncbi:unnamed protein product [Urochloa humidicola]